MDSVQQFLPDVGSLSHVVQTLQLAITPAFLLSAVAALLNVMSTRLARVVDRARKLNELIVSAGPDAHTHHGSELAILNRRIKYASDAIFLSVASAIILCAVVAVLFVARLIGYPLADVIAAMFILAMAMLIIALLMFMIEVRIATRALQSFGTLPKAELPKPKHE